MKVVLVYINNSPYSIGVGPYCFEIQRGLPVEDIAQRAGASLNGKLPRYESALTLATFALENEIYDGVEYH